MQQDRFRFRLYKDRLFKAAVILFSFSSALPLLFILFYIFKNGISVINWQFLTNLPKPVGEPAAASPTPLWEPVCCWAFPAC